MSDTRTVVVSMEFGVVDGKVRPVGGSAALDGVSTPNVCDTLMGVMEELIFHDLLEMPRVKKLLEFSPLSAPDGTPLPLEDRTKQLIVKLLAHQMLLSRVASRRYVIGSQSARLSLPYGD